MNSRSNDEVAQAISEWIDELNDLEDGALMIVEGKKDVIAMTRLGIRLEMVTLNLGLSVIDLVESIAQSRGPFSERDACSLLVIMTDWDRKGGKLARSLKEACLGAGLACDMEFRRRLAILTGRWIRDVESLPGLISSLHLEGPISAGM
ncbi:MAG: toprim domain-containing protein [Candidatus Thermoplasmatota archaeon]|nr:toprim domain-containing protein [Candidatus Thermoplasmatota archaeon]